MQKGAITANVGNWMGLGLNLEAQSLPIYMKPDNPPLSLP